MRVLKKATGSIFLRKYWSCKKSIASIIYFFEIIVENFSGLISYLHKGMIYGHKMFYLQDCYYHCLP